MYRIKLGDELQAVESGDHDSNIARQQTVALLEELSGLPESVLSDESHAYHVIFIERVVFNALRDICGQNELVEIDSRPQSTARDRALLIGKYVSGLSYDDIATEHNTTAASANAAITETLGELGSNKFYGKQYFAEHYVAGYPNFGMLSYLDKRLLVALRSYTNDIAPRHEVAWTDVTRPSAELAISDDSLAIYLQRLRHTPLLNAEQEVELAQRIEAGLVAERAMQVHEHAITEHEREELSWLAADGSQAFEHFYVANLRLVVSIAKKYRQRESMTHADMIQEGNLGLQHAIKKFDYRKGFKFSTYASNWIKQSITRAIATQADIIRKPVHVNESIQQLWKIERTLEQEGLDPTPDLLAERMKLDIDRVMDLLSWRRSHISLDTPLGGGNSNKLRGDSSTLLDMIGDISINDTDEEALQNSMLDDVLKSMQSLDSRTAEIILAHYGIHTGSTLTLAQIGKRHGLSAERVRQIEREGLNKLRQIHSTADAG